MSSPYFTKQNPIPGSRSLECEHNGLEELRRYQKQHGLKIPKIYDTKQEALKLERILHFPPNTENWKTLGEGLAKLHSVTADEFGFKEDNYIGLKPQKNTPHKNWGEFFYQNRLTYQVDIIADEGLKHELKDLLTASKSALIDFLNQHDPKASLLHGDLWSGNVMFDSSGPWLIDPAVYYGDRECDLAMTKIFDSFGPSFYESYLNLAPLPEGHEKRFKIYNLYHYLNHYNIFGKMYLSSVKEGFRSLPIK